MKKKFIFFTLFFPLLHFKRKTSFFTSSIISFYIFYNNLIDNITCFAQIISIIHNKKNSIFVRQLKMDTLVTNACIACCYAGWQTVFYSSCCCWLMMIAISVCRHTNSNLSILIYVTCFSTTLMIRGKKRILLYFSIMKLTVYFNFSFLLVLLITLSVSIYVVCVAGPPQNFLRNFLV